MKSNLFLLVIITLFFSCKKKDTLDDSVQSFILLNKYNLSYNNSGNDVKSFSITSNVDWVISSTDSWVLFSLSKGSGDGTIEIKCANNTSPKIRSAIVTISSSKILESKTITVNQLGVDKELLADIDKTQFECNESVRGNLSITGNIPWKIEVDSSWLKFDVQIGAGIATVSFITDLNFGAERTSNFRVLSLDKTFPYVKEFTVTQKKVNCNLNYGLCYNPPANFNITSLPNNGTISKDKCNLTSNEVVFVWSKSYDPEGGEVFYDVYLDDKSDPTTLIASNVYINQINFEFSSLELKPYFLKVVAKDEQNLTTTTPVIKINVDDKKKYGKIEVVAGNNASGSSNNQFNFPSDLFVDNVNKFIYIADQGNNRIQRWAFGAQSGEVVAGDGTRGSLLNQIQPHSVFFDGDKNLYISDIGSNRILKWVIGEKKGTVVAGGNGDGNQLNQLNPYGLYVLKNGSIFVCDRNNHRVVRWDPNASEGIVVAGGNGAGSNANQLNFPHNLFVDENENIYIADEGNDRVVLWAKGSNTGTVVAGGNGSGNSLNQLNNPRSVILDKCKNMYVVDYANKRIVKWAEGSNVGELVSNSGLYNPHSMAVIDNGDIYVVDDAKNLVQKWSN